MNTTNSLKTNKVAFCTYPKCQTTGMKCAGQCSQANCHVQSVPDGWQLMPKGPTPEMLREACTAIRWYEQEVTARAVYSAMLSSAPPAPQASVGDSNFESWFSTYDPANKGDKQRARDAYAAGMGELASVVQQGPTDAQIMATVGRKGFGFSDSKPLGQQWDQVCELIRAVVRERYNHPAQQAKPHPLSDVRDVQAMYKHPDLPTLREVFKDGWNCAEAARNQGVNMLTDEQIQAMYDECDKKSDGGNEFMLLFARAIESAATELLIQREAELMKENARLHRQNTVLLDEKLKAESETKELFNVFIKRDKNIAELERQLVEARKQMEAQKDEWLSWEAKRKALEKDAERWREWEKGNGLTVVIPTPTEENLNRKVTVIYSPNPYQTYKNALRSAIDAVIQKGQS